MVVGSSVTPEGREPLLPPSGADPPPPLELSLREGASEVGFDIITSFRCNAYPYSIYTSEGRVMDQSANTHGRAGITPEMAHERLKHLIIVKHLTEIALETLLPYIPEDHQAKPIFNNANARPVDAAMVEYVYSQIIPDHPSRVRSNFNATMQEIDRLFDSFVASAAVGPAGEPDNDTEEGGEVSWPEEK